MTTGGISKRIPSATIGVLSEAMPDELTHAKIDSRKVFYRSNRGAKDIKQLAFSADLPLWPGSNMVTVIARTNTEVRSVKTMYVYREPPRTAQAPK